MQKNECVLCKVGDWVAVALNIENPNNIVVGQVMTDEEDNLYGIDLPTLDMIYLPKENVMLLLTSEQASEMISIGVNSIHPLHLLNRKLTRVALPHTNTSDEHSVEFHTGDHVVHETFGPGIIVSEAELWNHEKHWRFKGESVETIAKGGSLTKIYNRKPVAQ